MSDFNTITAAIVTVLNTVSELKAVKDFETAEFLGFPAATVVPSENKADVFDTATNEVTYSFRIRIIDERKDDPDQTETTMRGAVDAVMLALRQSNDLANAVDHLEPVPSAWGYSGAEPGVVRTADIEVGCRVLKDL